MQLLQLSSKTKTSARLINFILISSSFCIIYLLVSLLIFQSSNSLNPSTHDQSYAPTSIEHIVFGIVSHDSSWPSKREYVKLWWRPHQMRGCIFLEHPQSESSNDSSLPPICISEDTSRFRYTFKWGKRSAIRVARVVLETVRLNHDSVRWFVFGDDDTVFFPDNLVKTLSKYDHQSWYYIGTNSEIYEQNRIFAFDMAFGGAGFAISYPLAKVFAKVLDACIERYAHLYGSDSRIYNCLAELGVGMTREPGFHQFDVRGDIYGLLAAHPLNPAVSLHHLDHANPIFPNISNNGAALQHLFKAVNVDSERIFQQTVCYDRWFSWTISVSWGYAVQIFPQHLFLPDALKVQQTFKPWKMKDITPFDEVYTFNSVELHPDPCRRPTTFFMHDVHSGRKGIQSIYKKHIADNCTFDMSSPKKFEEIRVFSSKMDLDVRQMRAPRRHCCDVIPPSVGHVLELTIRECRDEERIYMH